MPDNVSDGSSFTCPFCTSKLKLQVPSSPLLGDGKNIGNKSDNLFPPPGGQCTVIPSAPAPCTPSVSNVDPGQSPVNSAGLPTLGSGCKYMCAKGGLLTLDKSSQSSTKHDEASGGSFIDSLIEEYVDSAKILYAAATDPKFFSGSLTDKAIQAAKVADAASTLASPVKGVGKTALKTAGKKMIKSAVKNKVKSKAKQAAKKSATQKAIDGQKGHLTRKDLDAARRESKGEVVKLRRDGKPFDHQKEVNDAQQGLKKNIVKLKKQLNENPPPIEKARMEKELSEASKLLDHSENFIPSKPFKPPPP